MTNTTQDPSEWAMEKAEEVRIQCQNAEMIVVRTMAIARALEVAKAEGVREERERIPEGCQTCRELLSEGLDLCVRARNLDAMDRRRIALELSVDPDWEHTDSFERHVDRNNIVRPESPIHHKSGTVALWVEEQYKKDLLSWEDRSRAHLQQGCSQLSPAAPQRTPPMTTSGAYYIKAEREACERLSAMIALPLPIQTGDFLDTENAFSPWDLFPSIYGTYSSEFDDLAIETLERIEAGTFVGETLAHEIFREMLCVANFCDYGTSPRCCFSNTEFKKLLPSLIDKWKQYRTIVWEE